MKRDFKFFHAFRVRFAETDMHGHVFNGVYYTYFDTAISEYCRYLKLDEVIKVDNDNYVFHVVKTSAEYHAPVYFDDIIEVYVRVAKIGFSSLTFSLEIFRAQENTLLTIGEVIWVNTEAKTRMKASVSERVKSIITSYEGITL